MLSPGRALKVSIHLNEDTGAARDFLAPAIISFLLTHQIAGATLLRPEAGFGSHHRLHTTDGDVSAREHMPVRIEFIETRERVSELMQELCELVTDGLIEVQETSVIKAVERRTSV